MRFATGVFCLSLGVGLIGCSGSGGSTGVVTAPTGSSPAATTVALGLAPVGTVTTEQAVMATVTVSTVTGTAPVGSVVLSSGSYASFPVALSGGQASLTVPAGLLPPGNDTVTASFMPMDSAAFTAGSGSVPITVMAAGGTPVVTASSITYPTSGKPFRALPLSSGDVLVSVTGTPGGVQVFTRSGTGLQAGCLNYLRPTFQVNGDPVLGITLFANGGTVAEAVGDDGVIFQNAALLHTCVATGSVVSQGPLSSGEGTFDVAVSSDGRYAFVANEYGVASGASTQGNVGVVALQYDSSGNVSSASTLVGQIATGGNAIAGVLLSPDGTRLYITSEVAANGTIAAGAGNAALAKADCTQASATTARNGLLTVVDVAKAESGAGSAAILATVNAGCSPVRLAETSDRSKLIVTARGDNRVLVFSPGMLEQNANNALLGYADTGGTAPVGVALWHGQQLLAVANSNRFGGGTANLTLLNIAVPSSISLVQTVGTGLFPREVTVGTDDATLLLTKYSSGTLQVVGTTVR